MLLRQQDLRRLLLLRGRIINLRRNSQGGNNVEQQQPDEGRPRGAKAERAGVRGCQWRQRVDEEERDNAENWGKSQEHPASLPGHATMLLNG